MQPKSSTPRSCLPEVGAGGAQGVGKVWWQGRRLPHSILTVVHPELLDEWPLNAWTLPVGALLGGCN